MADEPSWGWRLQQGHGVNSPTGSEARRVDTTYQYDAAGRQLTPEEQANWREFDRRRAEAASIRRANDPNRFKLAGAGAGKGQAFDALYDAYTGTWSVMDKDGNWQEGKSFDDFQGNMSDELKKKRPGWAWARLAQEADDRFDQQYMPTYDAPSNMWSVYNAATKGYDAQDDAAFRSGMRASLRRNFAPTHWDRIINQAELAREREIEGETMQAMRDGIAGSARYRFQQFGI